MMGMFQGQPWEPLGPERQEDLQEKQDVLSAGALRAIKIFLERRRHGQLLGKVCEVWGQPIA